MGLIRVNNRHDPIGSARILHQHIRGNPFPVTNRDLGDELNFVFILLIVGLAACRFDTGPNGIADSISQGLMGKPIFIGTFLVLHDMDSFIE